MVRASTNVVIASAAARDGTAVERNVASFGRNGGRNAATSDGENVARKVGNIVEIARGSQRQAASDHFVSRHPANEPLMSPNIKRRLSVGQIGPKRSVD